MAQANPYAISRTEDALTPPVYPELDSAYVVPSPASADAPYIDTPGWAPKLRLSSQETPDSARLGERPLQEFYPDTAHPETFYGQRDSSAHARHGWAENVDANGWNELKGIRATDFRTAIDPRRTPPAEDRITEQLSPRSYSYTRPFMTGLHKMGDRSLNQRHFSMADHRRVYPVGDMSSVKTARNTFRIDPTPWDADLIDVPPNANDPQILNGRVQAVEVAYAPRNWRLG
jgi:hypothetical protein